MTNSRAVDFHRSSFCSGGTCVEVGFLADGSVAVRSSRQSPAAHRTFTAKAWSEFLRAVRAGEFERSSG